MLIGRTDDPQNPRRVAAFEVTNPFGGGSRNPSGPAVKVPRQTGRTHDRFSHQIKFFPHTPLHSKGRPHTPCALLRISSSSHHKRDSSSASACRRASTVPVTSGCRRG